MTRPFRFHQFFALALFSLLLVIESNAQNVGINSTGMDPHPSAMLDVNSNNKGVLIPRLTKAQRTTIPGPANGLLVFQTDDTIGFWFYNAGIWEPIFRTLEAGVGLNGGQIYSYGRIDLANTGVISNTYGSPDSIPQFTVNPQGQLVFSRNVALRERDSVIGNEISDTLNAHGMLELFGSGTSANPYRIGVKAGANVNDIWVWNGSQWTFVSLPVEKDSIVGNELSDTLNARGMLERYGSGTAADPYRLGMGLGNAVGEVWTWDGTKWVSSPIVHPLEKDSIIGNEVTDTLNALGMMNRFGSGTAADPYKLGMNPGANVNDIWQWDGSKWVTTQIVHPPEKDSIIGNEISDTINALGMLNRAGSGTDADPYKIAMRPGSNVGQVWMWNGGEWVPSLVVHPQEKDSVIGNEISDTLNARGLLELTGSGTVADPLRIGVGSASNIGDIWQWDGSKWVTAPIVHPLEKDSIIGNELTDTINALGMMNRYGTGTVSDPYLVGMNPGTTVGQVWTWNGSIWVPMTVSHPLEKDSVIGNEISDTLNARGILDLFGSGTVADPYRIGAKAGTTVGQVWQWSGSAWQPSLLPPEVDAIIGNEIYDTITNGFLTLSGAGTTASPKRVGMKAGTFTGAFLRWNGISWQSDSAHHNTLDMAYDQGGPGIGRYITADNGSVFIRGIDGFKVTGTFGAGEQIGTVGAGTRMIFNPRKAAFRAGTVASTQWDDTNVGDYSFAAGENTTASGDHSTALGRHSIASNIMTFAVGDSARATNRRSIAMGDHALSQGLSAISIGKNSLSEGENSISIGHNTRTEGPFSTAIGEDNHSKGWRSYTFGYRDTALGNNSIAIGTNAKAEGAGSMALGYNVYTTNPYSVGLGNNIQAIADRSVAIGSYVSTNNKNGSFIFGDGSTTTTMQNTTLNQMMMRFDGGYILYSNTARTTGVYMNNATSGWTNISDINTKENITQLNGEEILKLVQGVPVSKWNYKGTDPNLKYIGPMAQDFYRAFRLGGTDSLGINSINIDGVNFAAIKALIERTDQLKQTESELKEQIDLNAKQQEELNQLRTEMDEVKQLLLELNNKETNEK